MNTTLEEIIAKKKQKELEAARIAEKLAKAKRYKELKKRQQNVTSSSANSLPSSCSTGFTTQSGLHSSKENENPNSMSNKLTNEVSTNALHHSKDLHANSKLLSKAGSLVRDSQDPHTPIWVPGFSYPAQYCIRQTRSLSQKLQVDNVDCIDLDDCMFGSQRAKVKVEDEKSDSGNATSMQSTKLLKRKNGRRSKRRRRPNRHSQTSDSSDCGMMVEPEQPVDGVMEGDVSMLVMDEPPTVKNDVTEQTPPMGGDSDTAVVITENDNVEELSMSGCDDVISSGQQPMECDHDTPACQPTRGNDNTDMHTAAVSTNIDKIPIPDDAAQHHQSMGYNDSIMCGLTESMLLSIEASCDQQTKEQGSHDTINACRFWCEQGSNFNSKVTLCNDSVSHLQCNTVLKHSIDGVMIPLLRVSNIAVSDENSKSYVTIQLNGNMVVWVCSPSWTVLTHWEITDELDLIYFYTLPITGGVAVCTVTTSGTWRVSFIKENATLVTPQPVIHCISSSNLWQSTVISCWSSKSDVLIAFSCKDQIVIQMIEDYSEKVRRQIRLAFTGEVCSLCGVENDSTADNGGVWLLAATPTGIAVFDIVNECIIQNVPLSCSNVVNSLLPKCLRAIREDCYTFVILGYEYQKKRNQNKVVGWLVAIDNSNDTKTALGAGKHDRVLYAKLLREYVLPPSSSSSESFDYLSATHDNQLVISMTTPCRWLHSWDQFTGTVTTAWTISGTTGTLVQCNSTILAMDGGEEDCGNLYIYQLDKT